MGNIYVCEYGNHRIQLFTNGESEGRVIAGTTGIAGTNALLLYAPSYVKLDEQLKPLRC